MMSANGKPTAQRLRESIFCIVAEFGLTRSERLEVATHLLNQEVESFNDLGVPELARVLDGFQAAKYVASIKMDYKSGARRK